MITYPDYYRYGLVEITTAPDSGLRVKKINEGLSEVELHFQAPRFYDLGVPWAATASPAAPTMSTEDWITKAPTELDPHVSLVNKGL